MPVYLRKDLKTPSYWYRFQIGGIRFHGPTGCGKKADAEAVERRVRREEAERAGQPSDTLDMIAARWWREVGEGSRDEEACGIRLERIVSGLGPRKPINEVTFDCLSAYAARRRREPTMHGRLPAAATVNREIQLARRVFRRARKWGYGPQEIDWGALLAPEPPERVVQLSMDDEERIVEHLPEDWLRLIDFILISGWRSSAACNVQWTDVRTDRIVSTGKGGKRIEALRTPEIDAILDGQRGAHATLVFAMAARRTDKRRGLVRGVPRPIDRHRLLDEIHRACRLAGVPKVGIHDLRHTAATRLLRATGNLKMVQRLLDHSRIETTTKYAHVSDDDLRSGMGQVPKRTVKRTTTNPKGATIMKFRGIS